MDMTGVFTAVGSIGFPIVMCLLMGQYINKVTESHKEESKYFTEAINRNTEAITKLEALISHSLAKESDHHDN